MLANDSSLALSDRLSVTLRLSKEDDFRANKTQTFEGDLLLENCPLLYASLARCNRLSGHPNHRTEYPGRTRITSDSKPGITEMPQETRVSILQAFHVVRTYG